MKTWHIILIFVVVGSLIALNIRLMHINRQVRESKGQDKMLIETLNRELDKVSYLREFEYLYNASKEMTVFRLQNELYSLANRKVYFGADKSKVFPIESFVKHPKLIFGSSQNMCSPCVYAVLDKLKETFPNYAENENILFVADIEQRLKENYHHKKVLSFYHEEEFPLYKSGMPYLFVLDGDMEIKMLYITDKTSPDLTGEYLAVIKKRFPGIEN
ncbi:MAG: hypothetical protein LBK58_10965 [Prevotellaceae bacterium]|jgi:hypothetical protein|nr:hypothetical protein [Prevotellaceae bacterium]